MSVQDKTIGCGLIAFGLFVMGLFAGWVMNISALIFDTDFSNLTGLAILRVIGVFMAPLGGVLGWL